MNVSELQEQNCKPNGHNKKLKKNKFTFNMRDTMNSQGILVSTTNTPLPLPKHEFSNAEAEKFWASNAITPYKEFADTKWGDSQGRFFVLTINLKGEAESCQAEIEKLIKQGPAFHDDNVEYCCYCAERGKRGTKHLQCFIALKNKRRVCIVLKKYFHVWTHKQWPYMKKAYSGAFHNRKYCSKDDGVEGVFTEYPVGLSEEELRYISPKGQGHRTDVEDFRDALVENPWMSTYDMSINYTRHFLKSRQSVQLQNIIRRHDYIANFSSSLRAKGCTNKAYIGKSGTGKSYTARKDAEEVCRDHGWDPAKEIFHKTVHKWWDGYDGQRIVIIDDYRADMKFTELLLALDEHPFDREAKGKVMCLRAAYFFFTSDKHPTEWYPNLAANGTLMSQLDRRFICVRPFTEDDNPHYHTKVAPRLRKRNREGYVIEADEDLRDFTLHRSSPVRGRMTSTHLVRVIPETPPPKKRRSYRPSINANRMLNSGIDCCAVCESGAPCYLFGPNCHLPDELGL